MIRVLTLLLLLQAGAVAFLYWPENTQTEINSALITSMAFADVDRIVITDTEDVDATLTRSGERWTLNNSLPADTIKTQTLLASLLTSDPGLAIATSDAAARRFRVAEDNFERRIVLSANGTESTVFLGSSPSFRKVHARPAGSTEVFIVELNSYDAPTGTNAWLDRSLLALQDLSTIELYGVRFDLVNDLWTRADGESTDQAAMEQLVQALSALQVTGLVDDGDEDVSSAGETLRLKATAGGNEVRITVLDNPESERFYLSSDRFEATFNTSAFDAERLIDAAKAVVGIDTPVEG